MGVRVVECGYEGDVGNVVGRMAGTGSSNRRDTFPLEREFGVRHRGVASGKEPSRAEAFRWCVIVRIFGIHDSKLSNESVVALEVW
jgi:hypothetical protein